MKRFISAVLSALIITAVFCGCNNNGEKPSDNKYNYLTDTQLAFSPVLPIGEGNIAKCETGYYALATDKIYYIENETMKSTPLCNKPNCMHNSESCNAKIGIVDNIAYYDGNIYYMAKAGIDYKFEGWCLTKMSADGSKKEILLHTTDNCNDWIIHRGVCYYTVKKYRVNKDTGTESFDYADCYIYSYPLDKSSEPKAVYFAEEVEKNAEFNGIMAYGDNLYFREFGSKRDNVKEDIDKMVRLNLKDFSFSNMVSPQGTVMDRPMYLDGALIFGSGDKENGKYLYYRTDFDGNNPEKCFSCYPGEEVICDGKYLYVDNHIMLMSPQYFQEDVPVNREERYIKVYDSQLNEVDKFSLGDGPATTWWLTPIDDRVFMFAGASTSGDVVFYYDKNEFGTLNGKLWEKKYIYKENTQSQNSNDNKMGALSENKPSGSEAFTALWQKAKDKGYGVSDVSKDEYTDAAGGFSVKLVWKQGGGNVISYFPFLEFETEEKAEKFMNKNLYALRLKNVLVLVGVEPIPKEVHSMLDSILKGEPIEPIDSLKFSGENFTFS